MYEFLRRSAYLITGAVTMFVAAIWAAVLTIQGVLGLSAMPDDYDGTKSHLDSFLYWLLQQDPNVISFAAAGCLFLLGIFVIAHSWARRSPSGPTNSKSSVSNRQLVLDGWESIRLQKISNKRFFNTSVELDGKLFLDCEFENCTFVYNGTGPFEADRCIRKGTFAISTSEPRLKVFSNFLYQMQAMRGDFVDESGQSIPMRSGTEGHEATG